MEWVFFAGFGDVGREWPQDVYRDKTVMAGKGCVGTQLLLYPLVGGELPQALGDLPTVFNREEPQVAIPLAEHEVVCLPYLFGGGSEGGEGVGKAGSGEFPYNTIEVAIAVAEGGHLCRMGVDFGFLRQHFDTQYLCARQ